MKTILEKAFTEIGNDIAEHMYEHMTKEEIKGERAYMNKISKLEEQLKDGLTTEQKRLLLQISDTYSYLDCFKDDVWFRLGMEAGLEAGLALKGVDVTEKKTSLKEVI